jgi:hypothetical protein
MRTKIKKINIGLTKAAMHQALLSRTLRVFNLVLVACPVLLVGGLAQAQQVPDAGSLAARADQAGSVASTTQAACRTWLRRGSPGQARRGCAHFGQ